MKKEIEHSPDSDTPHEEVARERLSSSEDISTRRKQLRYLPLLALAIAIVVVIVITVEDPPDLTEADELKRYMKETLGYGGVFVMGLAGSASPVWPLPGSWAAFIAAGAGLNPLLLGLAAGLGEPLGETTAYMAGYGGQVAVTNVKGYRRVVKWMERHGAITLFLVCAIPNFLTKAAVIASGALRYPFWKFFPVCWAGKTIKSLGFAITGYYFFDTTFDLLDRLFG